MRRPAVWLLAAVVLTGAVVGLGVLLRGGDDGAPAKPTTARRTSTPPFSTTPLTAVDTSAVTIARAAFCNRVDPHQVSAALGASATAQRSWSDGDRVALDGNPKDVVHEFGCEYVAPDGTAARAWVFAPPVTAARAQQLVTSASHARGCTAADQPAFGRPSVGLTCRSGRSASASYRGLFGDSWLTCELVVPVNAPPQQLADRAGRWCVGVLDAASPPGAA